MINRTESIRTLLIEYPRTRSSVYKQLEDVSGLSMTQCTNWLDEVLGHVLRTAKMEDIEKCAQVEGFLNGEEHYDREKLNRTQDYIAHMRGDHIGRYEFWDVSKSESAKLKRLGEPIIEINNIEYWCRLSTEPLDSERKRRTI